MLRRRSRALLGSLLRPHRKKVAWIAFMIVTANLAALAGPYLVGLAVDKIPALIATKDAVPIIKIVAEFAIAITIQAFATAGFISAIGTMGGDVVLELRSRLFWHFQRLPVAFHERYTSGRVISRQVSDVDSISELFDEGLDSLVGAAVSMLFVGTGMLLLDWPLALAVMAGFIPLTWLSAWFRRESSVAYRRTRETIALVIVQFVETFNGIRAVQTFRRERRNEQIFGELNTNYTDATRRSMQLVALYFPGVSLIGNIAIGVVLLYGGIRVIDHAMPVGDPGHVPAVPAPVLRAAEGLVAVLQHVPVGRGRPGEDLRRTRRVAVGPRADRPSRRLPRRRRVQLQAAGSRSTGSRSPTGTRSCCPTLTWISRPARRSRWSARPARARPRSRGCWPGSTTRARARYCWTAWICATWPTPTCAARSC